MKRGRTSSLASDTAALTINDSSDRVSKYAAYEQPTQAGPVIWCSLPPHEPQSFPNTTLYETHYHAEHSHRCLECHRNFPSARFVDLHITESHDPICAARREAGLKIYACFVEGCDKICLDWKKRRSHLIDKHGFPRNYDFFIVTDGIDGRKSLLRSGIDERGHRKSSRERPMSDKFEQGDNVGHSSYTKEGSSMRRGGDIVGNQFLEQRLQKDEALDDIASSLSSLRMVPRNVKFGRRQGQAGFAHR